MSKVAEIVTGKIIEKLEKGVVPWHKPWIGGTAVNYVTQKPYKGINRLLLDGGEYLTFKQVQSIKDAKVKKGAKSHMVVFYQTQKAETEEDEEGNKKLVNKPPILRYYNVFNINDCEGIESKRKIASNKINFSIDACEELIDSYITGEALRFVHTDTGSAYYSLTEDFVNVPPIDRFDNSESYYATSFHEFTHSTGSSNRLKRDMTGAFGTKSYAREELVAEIGSAILSSLMGISTEDTLDNSASYCKSWLSKLGNDNNLILYASAKAEKAVQMIAPIEYGKYIEIEDKAVV